MGTKQIHHLISVFVIFLALLVLAGVGLGSYFIAIWLRDTVHDAQKSNGNASIFPTILDNITHSNQADFKYISQPGRQ